MSFVRNMGKTIGKYTNRNLSSKHSLLDHAKQSATDPIKTASQRVIQKTQKQLVI